MSCMPGKESLSSANPSPKDRMGSQIICAWMTAVGVGLTSLGPVLLAAELTEGYFQPVQIKVPEDARVSLAREGAFIQPQKGSITAAMQVGYIYRFQVLNIPLNEGFEVYPTIEMINRLRPPVGEEWRFPIPVELTLEDFELALAGKLVTRVIYLEPPDTALPRSADSQQQWYFDVGARNDPLQVAKELGRPMAIVRLGGIVPDRNGPTRDFLFGSPRWLLFGMDSNQPQSESRKPGNFPFPLGAR